MTPAGPSLSTAPPHDEIRYQRRELWLRRLFVAVLAGFVGAAGLGVLGVRTATETVVADGYELTVRFGRVTRPGLATPWSVQVRALDGDFDEPVVLRTTAAYFDLFDENGLDPDVSASTTAGEFLEWEFDPPDGDTLSVSFDARIEPAVQSGRGGETRLVVDGDVVAAVRFDTIVLP